MRITKLEWLPGGKERVYFDNGTFVDCEVYEFDHGPNGTWIRLVTLEENPRHFVVTQSGQMPSVTILHDYLPPKPPSFPVEEEEVIL